MVLLANSNPAANSELEGLRKTSRDEIKEKGEGEVTLAPKLLEGQDAEDSLGAKQASGILEVFSSIEQAVILAKCLDVKRSNPDDELRAWQMAPYIEAVSAQPQSDPMVRALCELLQIRWERLSSRTKERAYLTMGKMEEELRGGTTKTAVRMCHVFSVAFPMIEAMHVFEELELWDNLIDCYCLIDKKAAPTDLINERLKYHPNDPRLWCLLGAVTLSDECYLNASEVSKQRYARAQLVLMLRLCKPIWLEFATRDLIMVFSLWFMVIMVLLLYDSYKPYWIIKNSRGPMWGEMGFYRFAVGMENVVSTLWFQQLLPKLMLSLHFCSNNFVEMNL